MPRRRFLTAGLVISAAFAAGACATAASDARSGASSTRAKTIASATTSNLRVVLTATRRGAGAAPAATATVTTFERRAGRWERTGEHRLGGTYFWKTITGQRAVCRFEIRTTGPGTTFRPRAVVRLLLGPLLGCGAASSYPLTG